MKRILYDVPRWNIFMHREARDLDPVEREDPAQRQFEDELFERIYAGAAERLPETETESELRGWAARVHEACDSLPAFARLSQECRGNVDAAAAAVATLAGELAPMLNQPVSNDGHLLRSTVRAACQKASRTIEELQDAAEGLEQVASARHAGTDTNHGVLASGSGPRRLLRRLGQDARLKRIALLAGRFKRIAMAKQRSKVRHGADEVSDIERGANLATVLPSELVKLVHPVLRRSLMRDVLERQCLQYELQGSETLGKGPLVVCLDKSGSMEGDADIWATASALALLEIASRQKRKFALLGFDAAVKFEALVEPGATLPEAGLFVTCSGGTRIDTALYRALAIIEKNEGKLHKADIVLITDGESDPAAAADIRAKASRAGITILGLGIGVGPAALGPWCDRTETIGDLSRMEDRTAEVLFTT